MSSDPLVKAAIAHWGPRFVANGVVLTDFEEVTGALASYDDWCRAWSARAAHHEQLGREALAQETFPHRRRMFAARRRLLSFRLVPVRARPGADESRAHRSRSNAGRRRFRIYARPASASRFPIRARSLAGILRKPAGVEKPPVVAMAVGLDSTKEETDAYETPFLARGMATLVFEGPGQGEAQYDFPIRGDYEVPVKAVLDYIDTRRDLDAARIGMWGVSLGGYYAPRAAAFDKRIKACIALGGPFNWGAAWDGLPELTREAFRVRSHCKTDEDARKNAATLSLEGVAQQHHLPDLHRERPARPHRAGQDAERLAREVKGPVELMMIEDGNHIATNRAYRWRSQSADWMAEQLR